MQDLAYGLPRILLPRTRVNKSWALLKASPLHDALRTAYDAL
jgi:hypothetical protein